MNYTIKTELFGEINISQTDGLMEEYEVVLDNKNLSLMLNMKSMILHVKAEFGNMSNLIISATHVYF